MSVRGCATRALSVFRLPNPSERIGLAHLLIYELTCSNGDGLNRAADGNGSQTEKEMTRHKNRSSSIVSFIKLIENDGGKNKYETRTLLKTRHATFQHLCSLNSSVGSSTLIAFQLS